MIIKRDIWNKIMRIKYETIYKTLYKQIQK